MRHGILDKRLTFWFADGSRVVGKTLIVAFVKARVSALFSGLIDIAVRSAATPGELEAVAEEIVVIVVREVSFQVSIIWSTTADSHCRIVAYRGAADAPVSFQERVAHCGPSEDAGSVEGSTSPSADTDAKSTRRRKAVTLIMMNERTECKYTSRKVNARPRCGIYMPPAGKMWIRMLLRVLTTLIG